jgi:hypothetical protein
MTAYTTISNALVAVGAKPFATTIQALRDNILAIAEDDPTAPKIKVKHSVSGASAQTQTFTGLGDYSGIAFEIKARNAAAAARNLTIEYSTNGGSSWSAPSTLFASSSSEQLNVSGALDFAGGNLLAVIGSSLASTGPGRVNTTMAGASLAIDAVRFAWSGASTELVALIRPNGGSV